MTPSPLIRPLLVSSDVYEKFHLLLESVLLERLRQHVRVRVLRPRVGDVDRPGGLRVPYHVMLDVDGTRPLAAEFVLDHHDGSLVVLVEDNVGIQQRRQYEMPAPAVETAPP